jgi:outer membrane protein OmpA-like peptidoglycan-associated protein
MISGVTSFREERLIDADGAGNRIASLRQQIERSAITFDAGSPNLSPDQDDALHKIASDIQALGALSHEIGKAVRVEVSGYTDQTGTEEGNERLRQQRADTVRAALIARGVKPDEVVRPDEVVSTGAQSRRTIERKVTFKVMGQ